MPLTAYSKAAQRELDLEQWLQLNGLQPAEAFKQLDVPDWLRARAGTDVECSACGALGATLVRSARSKGSGKAVAQSHFRFRTAEGGNPHHPLCDFHDEQNVRGADYLTSFASDKSALTRAIRDLVCRGISAGIFSQAEMRAMRLWFLQEKAARTILLDVTPEQLQWCSDMQATRAIRNAGSLSFIPEHGSLTGFDWEVAAKLEWARRNEPLFSEIGPHVYFQRQSLERPLRLLAQHAGQQVLDPSALREKYDAALQLASFAAHHLFEPGTKPHALAREHPYYWKPAAAHPLLALSALLLFLSCWDLQRASALFCRVKTAPPAPDDLLGNLVGLNPFHDYQAWLVLNAARRIALKRTDTRPVAEQVTEVRAELQAQHRTWASSSERGR
ncbi:MAG: hypothetical protein ACOZE7_04490 [Pseudomonadota bacterium]